MTLKFPFVPYWGSLWPHFLAIIAPVMVELNERWKDRAYDWYDSIVDQIAGSNGTPGWLAIQLYEILGVSNYLGDLSWLQSQEVFLRTLASWMSDWGYVPLLMVYAFIGGMVTLIIARLVLGYGRPDDCSRRRWWTSIFMAAIFPIILYFVLQLLGLYRVFQSATIGALEWLGDLTEVSVAPMLYHFFVVLGVIYAISIAVNLMLHAGNGAPVRWVMMLVFSGILAFAAVWGWYNFGFADPMTEDQLYDFGDTMLRMKNRIRDEGGVSILFYLFCVLLWNGICWYFGRSDTAAT